MSILQASWASNWHRNWIPDRFPVPMQLDLGPFVLSPLTPRWNDRDYAAVMASRERLRNLFRPDDSWPGEGHSLSQNLEDLLWHEQEFYRRRSFAWVVQDDRRRYLGCAYLYPARLPSDGAEAFFWVSDQHTSTQATEQYLDRWMRDWLAFWPLARVTFPGRDKSWQQWAGARLQHYGEAAR